MQNQIIIIDPATMTISATDLPTPGSSKGRVGRIAECLLYEIPSADDVLPNGDLLRSDHLAYADTGAIVEGVYVSGPSIITAGTYSATTPKSTPQTLTVQWLESAREQLQAIASLYF